MVNRKSEENFLTRTAGIVKYKNAKATAQKKVRERAGKTLVRVNDILAELERQVGPLEAPGGKKPVFSLKQKEELKTFDVNMFLLEMERIDRQLQEVKENYSIADRDYQEAKESYEQIKTEYEKLEQDMAAEDEKD